MKSTHEESPGAGDAGANNNSSRSAITDSAVAPETQGAGNGRANGDGLASHASAAGHKPKPPLRALAEALDVSARWPIFPCNPLNKKPLTDRGFKDATQDRVTIGRWWKDHPNAMIGVPTGAVSGFIVIDVDVKDGDESGLLFWRVLGGDQLATRVHRTPSGGYHYLFAYDAARPVRSSQGKLHPLIDVRGDGGYVVFPPSVRADGKAYEVLP
jgi:hypothetical protein